MAERKVTWQVIIDAVKAQQGADKAKRSLEDLDREVSRASKNTAASDKAAAASTNQRNRSIIAQAKALAELKKANADAAAEQDKLSASVRPVITGAQALAQTVRQNAAARRAARTEDAKAVPVTSALTKAQQSLRAVELQRQAAVLKLAESQKRLSTVESQSGRSSAQYARALNVVSQNTLAVERSTTRLEETQKRLETTTRSVTRENDNFGRSANRNVGLIGRLSQVGSTLRNVFSALKPVMNFLKFGGMGAGVAALVPAVGQLAAGITALLGPLGSLGGVLASMPQAFSVAAGAVGTFMAAFSGIGAAVKAGMAAQTQQATTSRNLAKTERTSARAIASAQRAVKQARQQAAQQAVSDSRSIVQANRGIIDSQRAAIRAQDDLVKAREAARRELQDMKASLRDTELAERGASIGLKEAQQRLAQISIDPAATALDRQQAQLDVDQAKAALADSKKNRDRAAKDNADAQKKGVKGSDQVVNATDNERQALQAVKDAIQAAADARKQAAQNAKQNAEQIKLAQQAVKDAQDNARDSAISAAAATNKYADSMKNLSPEGKAFVRLLISLHSKLLTLQHSAQRGLLPGLGEALKSLANGPLFPKINNALETMGRIMGNTAKRTANMLNSPLYSGIIGRLLKSNERIMRDVGKGADNLLGALLHLMNAARPFTEWISKVILGWTKFIKQQAAVGDSTGKLAGFFNRLKGTLKTFGRILSNLFGVFTGIGKAGSDLGNDLFKSLARITKGWDDWVNSVKGQNALTKWFNNARKPLHQAALLIGAIVKAWFRLSSGKAGSNAVVGILKSMRTDLLPAIVSLINTINKSGFGEKLVKAVTAIVKALDKILSAGGGGALGAFVDIIGGLATLLASFPAPVLQAIGVALGSIVALRFVSAISGLRGLARGLVGLTRAGKGGGLRGVVAALGGMAIGVEPAAAAATAAPAASSGGRRHRRRVDPTLTSLSGDVGPVVTAPGGRHSARTTPGSLWTRFRSRKTDESGGITPVGSTITGRHTAPVEKTGTRRSRASAGLKRVGSTLEHGSLKTAEMAGNLSVLTLGVSLVGDQFGETGKKIADWAEKISLVTAVVDGFYPPLLRLGKFVGKKLGSAFKSLSPAVKKVGEAFKKVKTNPLVKKISDTGKKLKNAGLDLSEKLKEGFTSKAKGAMEKAGSKASSALSKGLEKSKGLLSKGGSKMASILSKGFGTVTTKLGPVFVRMGAAVTSALVSMGPMMMAAMPWILLVTALVVVIVLIIKHWKTIKKVVSEAIHWIIDFVKKHWDIIKWFVGPLAVLITLVVKHWDSIKKAFVKAVSSILSWFKSRWNDLTGIFSDVWKAIEGFASGFWSRLTSMFHKGVDGIKNVFSGMKSAVKSVWDGIKSIVGTPIEWVINTVLDKWLIGGVKKVLGFLHINSDWLKPVGPVHFARGGSVPGQGNRDTVPAMLMPGEFVLRRDAVKSIGVSNLSAMNEGRKRRRYATGGEVPSKAEPAHFGFGDWVSGVGSGIKNVVSGAGHLVKTVGGGVVDLARSGAAAGLDKIFDGVRTSLKSMPDLWAFDDMIRGMAGKVMDGAVSFVSGKEKSQKPSKTALGMAPVGTAQQYARRTLGLYGWGEDQWGPLQALWMRESGWNYTADNPTSSAYGIPQALPGSKMASAGSDWRTNPYTQINWGLDYIKHRYGSPARAWAHEGAFNWYGRGGKVKRFASGGRAGGMTPALLTPGEFVFSSDAVSRIGADRLHRMNRSGSGGGRAFSRFAKGGAVSRRRKKRGDGIKGDLPIDVQKFHAGGVVNGMKPGAKGNWVKALEEMYRVSMDGTWDPHLNSLLTKATVPSISALRRAWDRPESKDNGLVDWLRNAKGHKDYFTGKHTVQRGETVEDVLRESYGSPSNKVLQNFLKANGYVKVVKETPGTGGGDPGPALQRATAFAKRQSGKPYVWGGVGPAGYDCSGYQSAIINVLHGDKRPNHRLFATGSEGAYLRAHGFKNGLGDRNDYSVGWFTGNPGHTAGTLGTMNVESTGNHVRNGSAARGAANSMFPNKMYLPLAGTKGTPAKRTTSGQAYTAGSKLPAGAVVKLPNMTKYVGAHTWAQAKKRYNLNESQMYAWADSIIGRIRGLGAADKYDFMKSFDADNSMVSGAFADLGKKIGIGWGSSISGVGSYADAFKHILDHAYKRKHDDLAFKPWAGGAAGAANGYTILESAILSQIQANKNEVSWEGYLQTLADWGLMDLVNHLMDGGIDTDQNLLLAQQAAANRTLATRLDSEYKAAGLVNPDDLSNFIKVIALLNSAKTPPGMRDISRYLGLSDYDTYELWQRGLAAGKFKGIPSTKLARMNADSASFRAGTFYAAGGGQVPGVGSGDTVPAMLTPGEFVLKKSAAKALGLQNLLALNNVQKFAAGGPVLSPGIKSLPTISTSNISASKISGGTTINYTTTYDIDINNPIAEKSTRSMMKMMQRQAVMKKPPTGSL